MKQNKETERGNRVFGRKGRSRKEQEACCNGHKKRTLIAASSRGLEQIAGGLERCSDSWQQRLGGTEGSSQGYRACFGRGQGAWWRSKGIRQERVKDDKGGVWGPVTASDTDSKGLKGRRTKEAGSVCSWKGKGKAGRAEGHEEVKGAGLGRRRSKTLAARRKVTRENDRRGRWHLETRGMFRKLWCLTRLYGGRITWQKQHVHTTKSRSETGKQDEAKVHYRRSSTPT